MLSPRSTWYARASAPLALGVVVAASALPSSWAADGGDASAANVDLYEGDGAYRVRPWKREAVVEVRVEEAGLGEKDRTSAGEPESCETFRPAEAQIRRFFSRAGRVSLRGFLHETTWSACHAAGSLRLRNGERAHWMVQRLGAGSLTIKGRNYYFDCPDCRLGPPSTPRIR